MAGWRSELAGCRSTLSMSKTKVKISETKYRSFYKTLFDLKCKTIWFTALYISSDARSLSGKRYFLRNRTYGFFKHFVAESSQLFILPKARVYQQVWTCQENIFKKLTFIGRYTSFHWKLIFLLVELIPKFTFQW